MILPEVNEDEALIVARDIRAVLCERQIGPPIMVSIGIALLTGEEEVAADDILTRAQIALYEAKELGGDQARVFTGQATGALTWVQRIRTALAEDRFVLYGQPIADLRTGRITHHELLVRMLSEDGDIIPPAAFLPMAERFGVIGEIDRWVTGAGLRLAIDGEGVAINLSGYSIGDQSIVAEIRSAIADGVDPGKVIFDVTEAAAMTKLEATRQFAGTLYGLGCSLALDDFGTGLLLVHLPQAHPGAVPQDRHGLRPRAREQQARPPGRQVDRRHRPLPRQAHDRRRRPGRRHARRAEGDRRRLRPGVPLRRPQAALAAHGLRAPAARRPGRPADRLSCQSVPTRRWEPPATCKA